MNLFLYNKKAVHFLRFIIVMLFITCRICVSAQPGRATGPIVLEPGDSAAFKTPPADFDALNTNVAHGKIDSVFYDSKTVGNKRRMLVYTPPGYSEKNKYPVLYLLHGIGGDEKEWNFWSRPDLILDNLIAAKKAVPMIIIFPNGRAMADDRPGGNIFEPGKVKAFETFEKDLLADLIPFVETHYHVAKGKENRAIAGFSMGGGQSLNFGLGNPDVFAWVGGFSSAPNTKKPEVLIADPGNFKSKFRLIYISCGNKDGLITISRNLHNYLNEKGITHVYHIQPGEHNIDPWKKDLYNFSQIIFH